MAEDVAQVIFAHAEQLTDDPLRVPAVRAFEVAVLDKCYRRLGLPSHVVALEIYVIGEIDNLLGSPPELPCPYRRGQPGDDPEDRPRDHRREDRRAQDTKLRLIQ